MSFFDTSGASLTKFEKEKIEFDLAVAAAQSTVEINEDKDKAPLLPAISIDDTLGTSQSPTHSLWKKKTNAIKARPSGWLKRFGDKLTEDSIYRPPKTATDLREERVKASGWENVTSLGRIDLPTRPKVVRVSKIESFTSFKAPVSKYCYLCRKLVPPGAERIQCQKCPLIAHARCISNVRKFIVKTEEEKNGPQLNEDSSPYWHEERDSKSNTSTADIGGVNTTGMIYKRHIDLAAMANSAATRSHSTLTKGNSDVAGKHETSDQLMLPKLNLDNLLNSKQRTSASAMIKRQHSRTNFDSQPSAAIVQSLTSSHVNWICSFCSDDVKTLNAHNAKKFQSEVKQTIALVECIRVQSFLRMAYCKLRYMKMKNGFGELQAVARVISLNNKIEKQKANERYPFRILLHNITLVKKNEKAPFQTDTKSLNVPPFQASVIGELSAVAFESLQVDREVSSHIAPAAIPVSEFLLPQLEQPPSYSQTFKGERAVEKGSIFLTVICTEIPTNESIEAGGHTHPTPFSRCDIPLKYAGKSKLRPSNLAKLGCPKVDPGFLNKLNEEFHLEHHTVPKPYLLIPYSKSNVEVRMSISEVTEWPKSFIIGQCTQHLRYFISRKRTVSMNQPLARDLLFSDLPHQEEGSKLIVQMRPLPKGSVGGTPHTTIPNTTMETATVFTQGVTASVSRDGEQRQEEDSATIGDTESPQEMTALRNEVHKLEDNNESILPRSFTANNTMSKTKKVPSYLQSTSASATDAKKSTLSDSKYNQGGMICWSLITMGFSNYNDYGFLDMMQQEYASSTKRKTWCILIDKVFYMFNQTAKDSMVVRSSFDLRSSYIALYPDDVVRIKNGVDIAYIHFAFTKDMERWLRKLYIQSLSNNTLPYTVYFATMKKKFANQPKKTESVVVPVHHEIKQKIDTILTKSKSTGHPTEHRKRTSMEEVELLDLQLELYLADMKQKYIEYKAEEIAEPKVVKGATYRRFLVDVLQASVNRAKLVQKFSHL